LARLLTDLKRISKDGNRLSDIRRIKSQARWFVPKKVLIGFFMAGVEQKSVAADETGMRLDRWFKVHFPGLGFGHLQKLLRSGQVRVDGGRAKSDTRLQAGQMVRIPPLEVDEKAAGPMTAKTIRSQQDGDVLKQMLIYEDPKVFVFNKPAGLAVQGGSGLVRHVDGMLEAWRNKRGEKPRLVHRIDRDTSGVLVVARTRGAAQALTASFRERDTKKNLLGFGERRSAQA
jgi:23S rRNA pseudouridine955/2504/2580 synthase